ncbi:regulator of G-protein signaling 8-like [Daphnia carinata]|uniref:regulator of G-protein signaling 8-like n=1 Tax=Daphnia carinata TaxID=120202 RepID=UPI00257A33CC|nr:regulator of G-protein signaling 8-like [Daphnia carinata]
MIFTKQGHYQAFLDDNKSVKHLLIGSLTGLLFRETYDVQRELINNLNDERKSFFLQHIERSKMRLQNLKSGSMRLTSAEAIIPQPEEAQKWSESFTVLVASKYGSALYHAFLLREFGNENLEFWRAVEEYKHLKPQEMEVKASEIYNEFVADKAPKQVNLDAETRLTTLNNVQSKIIDQHTFDRGQRRAQHMMERDSYLRFLQSRLFLELAYPERF